MAEFRIADRTMAVLQKSLDLRAQKQEIIAGNIANAETPGYSARKFTFEKELRAAIDSPATEIKPTNPKHFPIGFNGIKQVQGNIELQHDGNPLDDGNSVSVEDEMFDLAENQLLFETGTQIMKKKLGMLKYAVSDGK